MGNMDMMIRSLILLFKDDFVFADRIYDVCLEFGVVLWKTKWNDIRCGYRECNKRRIDVDRVIRYCSKHCQKLDWQGTESGNHKKCPIPSISQKL